MGSIGKIERELRSIKERNRRVELDKAWETSLERKAIIFVLTYAVICIFLIAAGVPDPLVNALVPSAAFLLSTATLVFAKERWLQGRKNSSF